MHQPRRARFAAASLLCAFVALPSIAQAGMLSVFGDVDMWRTGNLANAGNQQVAANALGVGTNVLVSNQGSGASDLFNFYTNAGATTTSSGAELSAGLVAGIDLIVLDVGFTGTNPYSAAERSVISSFLGAGGNVMLIVETGVVINHNSFLADVGSSIVMDSFRCCGGLHFADTILATALTAGVAPGTFELGAANVLTGGTAAISDQGNVVVAFDTFDVPAPATLLLLGGALLVIGTLRRRD